MTIVALDRLRAKMRHVFFGTVIFLPLSQTSTLLTVILFVVIV